MEIESLEFLVDGVGGADVSNISVDLKSVVVHDHYQVVQLSGSGKHRCLPDLSFLDLTVAQKGKYPIIFSVHFSGQRHTNSCGNSLSKRTAGHIYARNVFHIRMALQIRAQMTQSYKILLREITSLCQCRIKSRRVMTL